jgi:hypothetical protein
MATFWLALIFAIADIAVFWALWRARGRPLPQRLEWLRVHPVTRWLVHLMEKPVAAGF